MSTPIFEKVKSFLENNNINYEHMTHEPTPNSEASAKARGEELKIGAKALLLKIDEEFKLFILSAACKVNSKKIREHFGASKIRFATLEELKELTTLVPGSVPPFGHPVLPFSLYIDISITDNEKIAFNAGSLTDSIIIKSEDYLTIAEGEIFDFGEG